MKQFLTTTVVLIFTLSITTQAKIWRVNNTVGANADFSSISAAITTAAAGDTIYVEGSSTNYSSITLTKRLVLRGPGYFLNETTPNPKTQFIKEIASMSSMTFNAGSKGSVVDGFVCNYVYLADSLITVQRNNIIGISIASGRSIAGDTIRNNYVTGYINGTSNSYKASGVVIYNNIIEGGINISSNLLNDYSAVVVNNNFIANNTSFACTNFIFQNNIFNNPNFGSYTTSNIFVNNIAANTGIPTGNNNQRNVPMTDVYEGWNASTGFSTDGRFKLKAASPAVGAGTLNGVAVDCGAFGGPAPYILSGMPAIPSIYELSMPSQVNSGTPSINISVSAAAH